jgi:hypothetical protein
MFLSGKLYLAIPLQQLLDERMLVFQFAHLLFEVSVFLIDGSQFKNHIAVALIAFF